MRCSVWQITREECIELDGRVSDEETMATGCPFPGCTRATHTPTTGRRTADPLLAQMCQEHRRRVRQTACERVISVPEAMAWLSRDRSAPKPVAVAKPMAPKVRPTAALTAALEGGR